MSFVTNFPSPFSSVITATKATPDFPTADQFFHIFKYQAEQILFADFSVTCVWKSYPQCTPETAWLSLVSCLLGCLYPAVLFSQQLPGWFKNQTCKHDTSPSCLLLLPNQMIWHPPKLLTLVCPLIPTHKLPACSSPLPKQSYRPCHCSFTWTSLLNLLDDFREISISNMQSSYYLFHGKMSPWGEQSEWTHDRTMGCRNYSTRLKQWKSSYRTQIKGKTRLLYFFCVWAILCFYRGIARLWTF